ncbi:hypothetical protein GCM10029992_23870 [Glycomyces albus]
MTRPDRAAAQRPPVRIQALRLLLLAQAGIVAALWLATWRSLQGYAWIGGGVETGLFERGLSYLAVLAPTLPVNLLAAFWLGRGGRRARAYLAGAAAVTAVQLILLLMPVDPGGLVVPGIIYALAILPVAFAALAIAVTEPAKTWLAREYTPTGRLRTAVETPMWAAAATLALAIAASVGTWVSAANETGEPTGAYDESDVWSRMEEAVTNTAATQPHFPGFESRTVEVASCLYRTEAGLVTYRYEITYEMTPFPDEAAEADFTASVRDSWNGEAYRLVLDGPGNDGTRTVSAHRNDDIDLSLTLGESPALHLRSGCVERVEESPLPRPPRRPPRKPTASPA